jgi:hypothetical protein
MRKKAPTTNCLEPVSGQFAWIGRCLNPSCETIVRNGAEASRQIGLVPA